MSYLIDNFDIEMIINVGVACSLSNDVVIKNVVIASDVCEYDIDITALGEPRGFINGLNVIKVKADEKISELLARTAISCGEKIHRGTIASLRICSKMNSAQFAAKWRAAQ